MKYKRKDTNKIDAMLIHTLSDVDYVINNCKQVRGVVSIRYSPDNESNRGVVEFAIKGDVDKPYSLKVYFDHEYVVWNDENVYTIGRSDFERKFELIREYNYTLGSGTVGHITASTGYT